MPLCIIHNTFYAKLLRVGVGGVSDTSRTKLEKCLCFHIAAVLHCSQSQDTVTIVLVIVYWAGEGIKSCRCTWETWECIQGRSESFFMVIIQY